MKLFKMIPFTHENRHYQVRILYDDKLINVTTFSNNYPANGFRYQIQVPKKVNVDNLLNLDNFGNFIDMAKNDIIENRWEKFKISP